MASRIVGLDIAASAVRAVELTIHDQGVPPTVEAYGQVGLPVGAVVDGEVKDRALVAAAIRRLWHEGGFVERRVNVGVAGLRAITRELDMPVLPPEELNDAVRFKADEVVPFQIDRTAISSKVIAQYTDEEGNPTLRVLVAAAHLDLIDALVATVNEAGLDPVRIDLNTAALVRALRDPSRDSGAEAIVSVGANLTLVVVEEGGSLQFVRTIDLGGESITAAIAGALDIPDADAELLKRRLSAGEVVDDRAGEAVSAAVDEIVDEIHNSVRFFSSLPGRNAVERVLLTGGGSQAVGFLPKLEQALDISVSQASATSLIDLSKLPMTREQVAAIGPTLPVPVGLGLPEESDRGFNLLPEEVASRQAQREVRRYQIYAGAVLAVLLVLLTVIRILQVQHAEHTVSSLKTQNAYISNVEIPKYAKVVSEKNQVLGERKEIAPILYGEVDWLVPFNQLGDFTPPIASHVTQTSWSTMQFGPEVGVSTTKAVLTQLPTSGEIIGSGSGEATVVPPPTDPGVQGGLSAVSDFETALGSSPLFEQVASEGQLQPQPDGSINVPVKFEINGSAHSQRLSMIEQPIS